MSENIMKQAVSKPQNVSSKKSPNQTKRVNSSSFVLLEKKNQQSGVKKTPAQQQSKMITVQRSNSSFTLDESFGGMSQSMQTDFPNPNTTLRDLSAIQGGTSSMFSRKESTNQEFYVPLKKRLQEKQMNSSMMSVVTQNNVKKIQVNLEDKRPSSKSGTRIASQQQSIRPKSQLKNSAKTGLTRCQTSIKEIGIKQQKQQQVVQLRGTRDKSSNMLKCASTSSLTKIPEEKPTPFQSPQKTVKQQREVVQIMVSLQMSGKKKSQAQKNALSVFAHRLWKAYRKLKHSQLTEYYKQRVHEIEQRNAMLKHYQDNLGKVRIIQNYYLNRGRSVYVYKASNRNSIRILRQCISGMYQGWKTRMIMKSKSVKNAISQCTEYTKFLSEMDTDPSVTEQMKRQFRANLPRSKQAVLDAINRMVSNKDWLKIIKREQEQEEINSEQKRQKVLSIQKDRKTKHKSSTKDNSVTKFKRCESVETPVVHERTWWEKSDEKVTLRVKQQPTKLSPEREKTPQPKQFLKRKSSLKYDPLLAAREAKNKVKDVSQAENSTLIFEDPNEYQNFASQSSFISSKSVIPNSNQTINKLASSNPQQLLQKTQTTVNQMVSTINNAIEKYEALIKEHQNQLKIMTQISAPNIAQVDISSTPDQLKRIDLESTSQKRSISYRQPLKSYRNSFSENINDSAIQEKTVTNNEVKNLMPSQRLAFLNRKKSPSDEEPVNLSKSQTRTGKGGQKEIQQYPKFTKTGLMIATVDQSSRDKSKDKVRKSKLVDRKGSPPLETIKEQISDLSYLKGVKSKVDCWAPKQPLLGKRESQKDKSIVEISLNDKKMSNMAISPQKSPKQLETSVITPFKEKDEESKIVVSSTNGPKEMGRLSKISMDDEMCNQQSPSQELKVDLPSEQQQNEGDLQNMREAIDQMSSLLNQLKDRFANQDQIKKEDFQQLLDQELESLQNNHTKLMINRMFDRNESQMSPSNSYITMKTDDMASLRTHQP